MSASVLTFPSRPPFATKLEAFDFLPRAQRHLEKSFAGEISANEVIGNLFARRALIDLQIALLREVAREAKNYLSTPGKN